MSMNPLTTITEAEFVAFDLETTGLHPSFARIVEIGAVRFRSDGTVLGEFGQLIDPKCAIPYAASRVNGLSTAMVKGQPTIDQVLPSFLEFLGETPVVLLAHNARFDLGFLSAALQQLEQPAPVHPTLDTCAFARRRMSLSRYNLETLGRQLGLSVTNTHRALQDATLLKEIFTKLLFRSPIPNHIQDLYDLSPPCYL